MFNDNKNVEGQYNNEELNKVQQKAKLSATEKIQKRTFENFKDAFYNFYFEKLGDKNKDVLFAYNKKVSKLKVWAYPGYNEKYASLMVYLNFDLIKENKTLVELTAKRMAIKIFLFKHGQPFGETSDIYIAMTQKYHIWNYGTYPETPQKWHVYKCTICGVPLAVFPQRLPNNNQLVNSYKTPWHNKKLISDGTKAHQGGYAYAGNEELTNAELIKILEVMHQSVVFTKNFTDNKLRFEDNDYDF